MAESAPTAHPPLRRRATLSGLEKLKVSVVLLVTDGERHLERVLSAVGFCDEMLVLDGGSTDRTRDICAAQGAKVAPQPTGPGRWRAAVALAKHDWVLLIAADEVLDYEAATTIQVLDYGDPTRAWRIRRRSYVGAREVRYGEWVTDQQVRLFNRTRAQLDEQDGEALVGTGGLVTTLQGSLHHYRFNDLGEVIAAAIQRARDRAAGAQIPPAGAIAAVVRAWWAFMRSFVVRQGFRDGVTGVVVALALAVEVVLAPALGTEHDAGPSG